MEKVSIIIVGYNARRWLPGFFSSLAAQTYKNVEVIFVDNNSADDSVPFIEMNHPEVLLIRHHKNSGFAGGNNIGLPHATGKYVLLLSTDVTVEPNFLEELVRAFDEIPRLGCVQPKMVFMYDKSKLDCCGSYFTRTGFLKHVGVQASEVSPEYNRQFPVLSIKGACMMFQKDILQKTGGLFDADFWNYFEETDFCFRVWLAGYECWYYPRAVVYHAMGGSTGFIGTPLIQYHSFKNRITTYLKSLSVKTLLIVLPAHFFLTQVISLFFLLTLRLRLGFSITKAWWYNISNLPMILKKRRLVQTRVRKISDREFLPKLSKEFPIIRTIIPVIRFLIDERRKNERNKPPTT